MAYRLLMHASWRFFTRHPWQLWLTLLSIALGTAVIIAVELANQTAAQSFTQSVNVLSSPMTHQISSEHEAIPDEFYRQLRVDWGYRHSSPQVEIPLTINGLHYTLLGLDPFAVPVQPKRGEKLAPAVITTLLTEPNSVIVPKALGLAVGQSLQVKERTFKVAAVADFAGDSVLLADIATVQGSHPGLTRIQLQLTEAEARRLQSRLPAGLKLESVDTRQQLFAQMTQAFSTNLLAMSLLAMLVGAFLVYNTMTFSVLQRRHSFAINRLVGVTARQLFGLLLTEALLLGVIGSALGVALGVLLGQGLLVLVTQTISDLYVSVHASDLLITPIVVAKGVGVTLLAVLVATLRPALEAARVSPVQVQRRSSLEQSNQRLEGKLALLGMIGMLLSGLLLRGSSHALVWGFMGLFVLIVSYSLVVPWMLRGLLKVLQQLLMRSHTRRSLVWPLAIRGVEASLSRTSLAIIALTVAVSATVGVSIMIGSFRSSVAQWLETTLSSDLYVSATTGDLARVQGTLQPAWLERIHTLPEVASISYGRSLKLNVAGMPTPVLVLHPAEHSQRGFEFLQSNPDTWQHFIKGEGILVSEPFAYHQRQTLGDKVALQTDAGKITLPIIGVFRDYSATQGMLVLPRNLYERYWQDRAISSIGMVLKANADEQAVKAHLQRWAPELSEAGQALVIRSNKDIRDFSLQVFDRTFAITHVLRVLVIIVAFVGVFSALMALFMEKGREFAILRATGFTPQQLQRLVWGQSALMGLLAGILALPLGWLMSLVLIDIINQRSFGWTMQTHVPGIVAVQALLLALIAALLASFYPVKRLAQASIREGLNER